MTRLTGLCLDCSKPIRRESNRCATCAGAHSAAIRKPGSGRSADEESVNAFARRVGIRTRDRDLIRLTSLLDGAVAAYWDRRVRKDDAA